MTQFIGIISAKGGVGKTTTAINLSSALSDFGRDVITVDGDIETPNLTVQLGITKLQTTIHDVLQGKTKIENTIYSHPSGIKIIGGSTAYFNKDIEGIKIPDAMSDLKGKSEAVIIDSAPGLDKETESVIKASDYILFVTTPDLSSVTDTRKTVKLVRNYGKPIVGAIVNRVRRDNYEMDPNSIKSYLECPVVGEIPEDHRIRASQQLGNPVVHTHPDSPAAEAYKKLAALLIGSKYESSKEPPIDEPIYKHLLRGFIKT